MQSSSYIKSFAESGKRILIPVVRFNNKNTFPPSNLQSEMITIKAYDFLSKDGKQTKPLLNKVLEKGNLHTMLYFNGSIILSSVMRDETLFGLTNESYALLVNTLKPEYYFTPDGETYLNEGSLSAFELKRIMADTQILLKQCMDSKPIGLVKGCTEKQIQMHSEFLKTNGVDIQVFHAGDYLRRGTKKEAAIAYNFARIIRKYAKVLLIYGIGSKKTIRKFNFADGFITQTHFLHNPKTQTWENFKRIEIFVGSLDDAAQSKLNTMSGENHRWGE